MWSIVIHARCISGKRPLKEWYSSCEAAAWRRAGGSWVNPAAVSTNCARMCSAPDASSLFAYRHPSGARACLTSRSYRSRSLTLASRWSAFTTCSFACSSCAISSASPRPSAPIVEFLASSIGASSRPPAARAPATRGGAPRGAAGSHVAPSRRRALRNDTASLERGSVVCGYTPRSSNRERRARGGRASGALERWTSGQHR